MKSFLPLVSLLILAPLFSLSQGWEQKYGSTIDHRGYYAYPTPDGAYVMAASSTNAVLGFYNDMKIIKTDSKGDTLWSRTFNDVNVAQGRIIELTRDGGYIMIATDKSGGGLLNLTKLKADGTVEWRKNIATQWNTINVALLRGYSIRETADGGFVIAGELSYVGAGSSDAILVKTNSTGLFTWGRTFRISWLRTNIGFAAEQTADGGYIITGYSENGGFIIKCDAIGIETWQKVLLEFSFTDVKPANNTSGYVLVGSRSKSFTTTRPGAYFVKLNDNGDTLFTKYMGEYNIVNLTSINKTNDNGYCISGYTRAGLPAKNVLLIKTDGNGDTAWTRNYGDPYDDFGYSARQTDDGNYIIAGTATDATGKTKAYLIRTDKLGNTLTNVISGNVFEDLNNNCQPDASEKKLFNPAYWKVRVTPGDKYAVPDSSGRYNMRVDTGTHQVSIINSHPFWESGCPSPSTYAVAFHQFYDTVFNRNFGLKIKTKCPLMKVDVATGIVRPCRETTHTISYCNEGTADANNAYVEFTLDPAFTFISSVPALSSRNGNILRFNIGTVKAGNCGTIYIKSTVACTAVANSSVCVTAKVYPDSICVPVSPGWDKSSVKVTGACVGNGRVKFVILNTGKPGEGDMQGSSEYRIYVDNALVQTNTFKLKGGDSLVIRMDACGKTVRLEADQRPGHPGNSHPRATVEGCTGCATTPTGPVGTRTAVAEDDADETVEIDCAIVRASFDPNEKLVVPSGITASHYVPSNVELEYRINFQNTGNDTAFLVVLRDTLDANTLDVSSLVPGIASHNYTFKITGKGVLEWTFENILLPDSTTNEKASHGFVKFKIKPLPGLNAGTTISNKSAIYFDFNAPVITKPAVVTVSNLVPHDAGNYNIISGNSIAPGWIVTIVPHPLVSTSMLEIRSPEVTASEKYYLNIFDATGRKIKTVSFVGTQTELKREWFGATGLYFCEISKGSKSMVVGKLLVK